MSKIIIHAKQRPFDVMYMNCDFFVSGRKGLQRNNKRSVDGHVGNMASHSEDKEQAFKGCS